MLRYPTLALLEGYNIGIVVVSEEVSVHLTMILRRAEDVVYLTYLISLAMYHLLEPASQYKALCRQVVAILIIEMYHINYLGLIYRFLKNDDTLSGCLLSQS